MRAFGLYEHVIRLLFTFLSLFSSFLRSLSVSVSLFRLVCPRLYYIQLSVSTVPFPLPLVRSLSQDMYQWYLMYARPWTVIRVVCPDAFMPSKSKVGVVRLPPVCNYKYTGCFLCPFEPQ